MVTDRTQTDVETALQLKEKIKSGQPLSESENLMFERGFFTINTLNRIEEKQNELGQILNNYGYYNSTVNKEWVNGDILSYVDYHRILNNLDELKNAFTVYQSTPQTPEYMYGYEEVNDIEKILVDIEELIGNMAEQFLFSYNDLYSGGV